MGNWVTQFTSRNGDTYTITISGRAAATDLTLTAAPEAFYSEEEGDEDLFVNVKVQTGYISIITDDVELLREIIPNSGGSRKVVVRRSGALKWVGYVQPKMLSSDIWNGKNTVRIPVECPLSAMKYRDFVSVDNTESIARIIDRIKDSLIVDYVFQGSMLFAADDTSAMARAWLRKEIFSNYFVREEFSNLDALEAICAVFGWTVRTRCETMYFNQYRNVDAVGSTQIVTADGGEILDGIYYNSDWLQRIMPSRAYDCRAQLIFFEGIKKAEISSMLNPFDDSINLPDNDIKTAIANGTWNPRRIDASTETVNRYYYEEFSNLQIGDWIFAGFNVETYIAYQGETHDINNAQYNIAIASTPWMPINTDPQDSTDPLQPVGHYLAWFKFEMANAYSFPGGGQLELNPVLQTDSTIDNTFYMIVKIGDLWYNASNKQWENHQAEDPNANRVYLEVSLVRKNETFAKIPLPAQAVADKLSIEIHSEQTILTGFEINFTSKESLESTYNSGESEIVHSAASGVEFSKTLSLDSPLAITEKLAQASKNFLLDPSSGGAMTFCEGLYDSMNHTQSFNPLQRTVDEAAEELAEVGEKFEISIPKEDFPDDDITPQMIFYNEYLDTMFYPVAISRDWSEDVFELVLLKRKMSNQ